MPHIQLNKDFSDIWEKSLKIFGLYCNLIPRLSFHGNVHYFKTFPIGNPINGVKVSRRLQIRAGMLSFFLKIKFPRSYPHDLQFWFGILCFKNVSAEGT
jgi:hypothetical protein